MSEMVERVAKALSAMDEVTFPKFVQSDWGNLSPLARAAYLKRARAAIQAMKSPTDSVKVAGGIKCENIMFQGEGTGVVFNDMGLVFDTMIDAMLKEK